MSSASELTPAGVAARLTQSSSAHLFLGFLALAAALFVFFTLSNWLAVSGRAGALGRQLGEVAGSAPALHCRIRNPVSNTHARLPTPPLTSSTSATAFPNILATPTVLHLVHLHLLPSRWQLMRWLASLLGCIKDSGAAGEAEFSNTPEFAVAVRSQLLVGPATYSIHANPAYTHAFERMEQLHWEEQVRARGRGGAGVLGEVGAWLQHSRVGVEVGVGVGVEVVDASPN